MKQLLIAATLVLGFMATGTLADAQNTPEPQPTGEPSTPITVDYGPYSFEVDGNQPLITCVLETRDNLDGRYFTGIVLARNIDGYFMPMGTFESRATAGYATLGAGECAP